MENALVKCEQHFFSVKTGEHVFLCLVVLLEGEFIVSVLTLLSRECRGFRTPMET